MPNNKQIIPELQRIRQSCVKCGCRLFEVIASAEIYRDKLDFEGQPEVVLGQAIRCAECHKVWSPTQPVMPPTDGDRT